MFLARITGHVVATQKDKTLNGQKLFVVEPLNVKFDDAGKTPASLGNTGRAIVAIDVVGAGEGQVVLIVQGSSARMTDQTKNLPAGAGTEQGIGDAHLAIEPRRSVDCFSILFGRQIDDSILGLATGEAMAHLRHLEVEGRAVRDVREGVNWYVAA